MDNIYDIESGKWLLDRYSQAEEATQGIHSTSGTVILATRLEINAEVEPKNRTMPVDLADCSVTCFLNSQVTSI